MDVISALRLQLEWGADEALADAPVDRFVAPLASAAAPKASAAAPLASTAAPKAPEASRTIAPPPPAAGPAPRAAPRPAALVPAPAQQRAQDIAAACTSLAELRTALAAFDGCPLATTATNLVFADGNPGSGLMLVGEGPGAEEDRAGLPFVGPSGQFLDRMLASVGLDRTRFYITNLIPWRPPGNRNPTDAEVVVCLPFLLRHIALVRPRRLVLLGALSMRAVTNTNAGITRVRGKWTEVSIPGLDRPVPTLPMLHPAYLLRTHGAKRDAWADMITLRRALDTDG